MGESERMPGMHLGVKWMDVSQEKVTVRDMGRMIVGMVAAGTFLAGAVWSVAGFQTATNDRLRQIEIHQTEQDQRSLEINKKLDWMMENWDRKPMSMKPMPPHARSFPPVISKAELPQNATIPTL